MDQSSEPVSTSQAKEDIKQDLSRHSKAFREYNSVDSYLFE
jgi:hypothetical protein